MKRVLVYIFLLILIYLVMFHIDQTKVSYITASFYLFSVLTSLSNIFIRFV